MSARRHDMIGAPENREAEHNRHRLTGRNLPSSPHHQRPACSLDQQPGPVGTQ
tara:strand:+ start:30731 stop:30889 length:159 start_codon:yes stop_codon:yes gene_type:complete